MQSLKNYLFISNIIFIGTSCIHNSGNNDRWENRASGHCEGSGLSQEEVRDVIRENLDDIRLCYEAFLKNTPTAQGVIVTQFEVRENGSVGNLAITKNTLESDIIARCFRKKMSTWRIPEPRCDAVVDIVYPFTLNPY